MESFLEKLKKVAESLSLSPEAKMQSKVKLVRFMESPVSAQEEMLSEFSEQSAAVKAPVAKTTVSSKVKH